MQAIIGHGWGGVTALKYFDIMLIVYTAPTQVLNINMYALSLNSLTRAEVSLWIFIFRQQHDFITTS